jgi:Condensin II non structural maintenance of chromosomes subunit
MHTTLQVRELTAIIRNQIPAGRKSILDAYGEIAFQAWRNTFGGCRFEVEHTLLQVRARAQRTPLHRLITLCDEHAMSVMSYSGLLQAPCRCPGQTCLKRSEDQECAMCRA